MNRRLIILGFSLFLSSELFVPATRAADAKKLHWNSSKTLDQALTEVSGMTYWYVGSHALNQAFYIEREWGNKLSLRPVHPGTDSILPVTRDSIFPKQMTLTCNNKLECTYNDTIQNARTKHIAFRTDNAERSICMSNIVYYSGPIEYHLKLRFLPNYRIEVVEPEAYAKLNTFHGHFSPSNCRPETYRYSRFIGAYSGRPLNYKYNIVDRLRLCEGITY